MSDGYRLAIMLLDDAVADTRKRMEQARLVGAHARQPIDYGMLYDPHLIHQDTVIDGVEDALNILEEHFLFKIIYITPRPEKVRNATITWLLARNLWFPGLRTSLIMRQEGDTRSDKEYIQDELVRLQHYYSPEQMIYVDSNPEHHIPYARCYVSLHSCIANTAALLSASTPDAVNTATIQLEQAFNDKDYQFTNVVRACDVPELHSKTAGWVICFQHKIKKSELALLVWWENDHYHVSPLYRVSSLTAL